MVKPRKRRRVSDEDDTEINGKLLKSTADNENKEAAEADSKPSMSGLKKESTILNCGMSSQPILARKLRGLLNRLSSENFEGILSSIVELFSIHGRNDTSELLQQNILKGACDPKMIVAHLLPLHTGIIAGLHSVIGPEISGRFLHEVATRFSDTIRQTSEESSVSGDDVSTSMVVTSNLLAIMSQLLLIESFTSIDVELLLCILLSVGSVLRSDDPLALKDIIIAVQKRSCECKILTSKQKRLGLGTSGPMGAFGQSMGHSLVGEIAKKLNRLNSGSGKAGINTTQLLVSWKEAQDKAIMTRRWAGPVGATPYQEIAAEKTADDTNTFTDIARKQRMNTDIRRAIFSSIFQAEDFSDAFERILKLGLKDEQQREIVRVLVDCCGQEKKYNPFYGLLGQRFCSYDHNFKFTFQFTFWDQFKLLEDTPIRRILTLSHLLADLIGSFSLSLSILKVLEWEHFSPQHIVFFRSVFAILLECDESVISKIFSRIASSASNLRELSENIRKFLKKEVKKHLLQRIQTGKLDMNVDSMEKRLTLARAALRAKGVHTAI